MSECKPPSLTLVDLFAGCGGLSLGMENAGFTPVFVNELNEHALETYLRNRSHRVGGKLFAEQPELHSRNAHELQSERLEKMVADLSRLGIVLPTLQEAQQGANNGTLDLLTGGPPCQGYSGIGHRRSYAVDKQDIPSNQLYQRMAAIIERLRPRIFLFENVRGLLNSYWTEEATRKIWPDVKKRFEAIKGYEVRFSLVKASDYGVPQNRPRVLLVGIRSDIFDAAASTLLNLANDEQDAVAAGFLPRPSGAAYPDLVDLLSDLVDPTIEAQLAQSCYPKGLFATRNYLSDPTTDIQRRLRTTREGRVLALGEPVTDHEYSKHSSRIVSKFQHMLENHGEIPEEAKTRKFSQRVLRRRWGNLAPNITATSMPDDYVHFAQARTLTVREWARLQLFPDWYEFAGKRTTGGIRRAGNPREGNFEREVPKYTQIGNAVPVGLAEEVGRHFNHILSIATRKSR
ncbi:DNA (cytosine-5-)-methyltransferase [Agrobacterium salinitolerans]|nr:DNA (cytosine-5-)-methyltransferase [Agrobacterium salinitolerans]